MPKVLLPLAGLALALTPVALTGCGYTEQEMMAKQRKIDALTAQLEATKMASQACVAPKATRSPRARASR